MRVFNRLELELEVVEVIFGRSSMLSNDFGGGIADELEEEKR